MTIAIDTRLGVPTKAFWLTDTGDLRNLIIALDERDWTLMEIDEFENKLDGLDELSCEGIDLNVSSAEDIAELVRKARMLDCEDYPGYTCSWIDLTLKVASQLEDLDIEDEWVAGQIAELVSDLRINLEDLRDMNAQLRNAVESYEYDLKELEAIANRI